MKSLNKLILIMSVLYGTFFMNLAYSQEQATFLVKGISLDNGGFPVSETFSFTLSDSQKISEARNFLALDSSVRNNSIIMLKIGLCNDGSNRNYSLPGHPAWSWCVEELVGFLDISSIRLPDEPKYSDFPSKLGLDPSVWIQENGDEIAFKSFRLVSELSADLSEFQNVSLRGNVASGERTLIAGLIVREGAPKTILIRGIGPSLIGSGIQNVLENPKVTLYQEQEVLAQNDDWESGQSLVPFDFVPEFLIPEHGSEAALLVDLLPGAYTIHLTSSDDVSEGVGLIEAYSLDDEEP